MTSRAYPQSATTVALAEPARTRMVLASPGVTVAVKGSRAFATDKNTITLPATADFLSGDAREAMEGMLDHETSHIRAEAEARAEGKRTPLEMRAFVRANETKVVFDLTNVFEDIRVDRGAAARWAGVATNLVACRRFCYEQIAKKLASGEELPALFLLGCGIIAQAHGEDDFAAKLPAATRVVLAKLADEVADSRKAVDAEDVLALSRRVAAKLAALAEKEGEAIKGKSVDELKAELAALDEGKEKILLRFIESVNFIDEKYFWFY